MPSLNGILETALYVDDLDRAARFYEEDLGLERMVGDQRFHAYRVGGKSVLLLFKRGTTLETVTLPGGSIPPHNGHGQLHIAFAVSESELEAWEARLHECGIAIEGRADWPKCGRSLYFRDPDGHLLEFATPGLWPL